MTRLRLWHAFFRPAFVLALPLLLILQLGGPALALTDDQTLVVDVWRLVNESYVDSSFSGVPWRRLRQKALEKTISNRVDAYDAIEAMLAPLDDPYTRLLRPQSYGQLEAATKGTVSGIGLQLGINHDSGSVVVIAPVEDSPAAEAGLVDGTLLRSINGQATSELGLDGSAALLRGRQRQQRAFGGDPPRWRGAKPRSREAGHRLARSQPPAAQRGSHLGVFAHQSIQ